MKKIISLILCVLMVVSMLPVSALALELPELDVLQDVVEAVETEEMFEEESVETETPEEITVPKATEVPVEVAEEEYLVAEAEKESDVLFASSGTCGDNLTWTLDENGVLTISGTGAMTDFSIFDAPWYDQRSVVTSAVINSGVTSIGEYALYNCDSLSSVSIPDSVTSIGEWAFYDCSGLTEITIPEGVTSISYGTFYNCTELTGVTLPDSITSIGGSAFYNCTELTDVTLPDGITSIGSSAFYNCRSIRTYQGFDIPDSVTSIGGYAFCNCYRLYGITIPEGVTSIADGTFSGCESLVDITIPDSITSIGKKAFYGCIALTEVTIPDGVTSIGSEAFCMCSLTSIDIPDSVTSIGSDAFVDCSRLTSITIGSGVTSIGSGVFGYCANLTAVTVSGSNMAYSDVGGVLYDKAVTKLICCPSGKTGIYSIPDSVTSISARAFLNSDLTSVTIPNGVTTIGNSAFCYSGLTSIIIPDSVTDVGTNAFYGCSALTSAAIGGGVTDIGNYAFYDCRALARVAIGNSVSSIGDRAFFGCESLTSVTIPNSVISIGDYAFGDCDNLASVNISDSVTSIGGFAFYVPNSTEITVYVPDKDELSAAISGYDWTGDNRVVTFTTLNAETDSNTGDWDGNLTWTVEDGVMTISGTGAMADFGWFEDENGEPVNRESPWKDCFADVTKIIISEGITSVGEEAFLGWATMTSELKTLHNHNQIELVLPDSLASVASSAFFGTKLGTVHVGSGLKDIPYLYDGAFSGVGYYIISEDNPNYTAVDGVLYNKDGTSLLQIPRNVQLAAIPETVTSLGEGSLVGWALEEIVIPDTVTSIGSNTILSNSTVTDVTFGNGVTAIPDSCLAWCPSLKTVTIPLEITAIGTRAFEMVESLTDVYYEGTKAQWENISMGEDNTSLMLSSVTIHCSDGEYKYESLASGVCGDGLTWDLSPNGVLTISGTEAMKDYGEVLDEDSEVAGEYIYISAPWPQNYVTAVILEDGVTSIGSCAFAGCVNLGSVTIPDTVTSIGESAFFFPEGGVLGDIYFNGMETQWAAIAIGTNNDALSTATLHCQTLYSAESGIQVTAKNELAEGVILSVESVNKDNVDANVLVQIGDATSVAYNISLLDSNRAETQPNGSIEIRVPVPSGFDGEKCVVYRLEEDGTLTDMQAEYIDGYMVFTTEHLSLYLLAQPKPLVLLGDVTGDDDINVQDLVRLMKYIAGMDVEVVETECDTNQDDKIDILDVIRLVKTLA